MIRIGEQRRSFLRGMCAVIASLAFLRAGLKAQTQRTRPQNNTDSSGTEDNDAPQALSRKSALEENEKDIKKKIGKLFQLASELKDEAEKTDSAKVLSVAMVRKAEEIEKLAKEIKSRAKG